MSLKDYEGPEQLAGALYQIDPTFNPDAVPDLAHPQVDPDAEDSFDVWPLIAGVVGFLASLATVVGAVCCMVFYFKGQSNVPVPDAVNFAPSMWAGIRCLGRARQAAQAAYRRHRGSAGRPRTPG